MGGVIFFPLLQVSFIITHAFSDMEKTFLTSNTLLLLTMSKHLVFTSFPPPNCFAVRNSFPPPITSSPSFPRRLWLGKPALLWSVPAPLPALMPPAPAELGTRPPETLGPPPRLWHSGNVAMAPAKKGLETAGSSDGAGRKLGSRQHRAAGSRLQDRQGRWGNVQGAAGHKAIDTNRGAAGRMGTRLDIGEPQLTCTREDTARESSRNPSTCRVRER